MYTQLYYQGYLGYTVSILRVPSDTKRRVLLLPARSDIGSYGTTGTSLLIRTADRSLHFERQRSARSTHAAGAGAIGMGLNWQPRPG